jgi:hypothetical protein
MAFAEWWRESYERIYCELERSRQRDVCRVLCGKDSVGSSIRNVRRSDPVGQHVQVLSAGA